MNEFIDMHVMDLKALEASDILKDKIENRLLAGMLSEAVYCVDVLMLQENKTFEYACELANITTAQYAAVKAKIAEKTNKNSSDNDVDEESAKREKEREKRDFDALYKLIYELFTESGHQKIWLTNRLPYKFYNAYYAYVHSLQDKADVGAPGKGDTAEVSSSVAE